MEAHVYNPSAAGSFLVTVVSQIQVQPGQLSKMSSQNKIERGGMWLNDRSPLSLIPSTQKKDSFYKSIYIYTCAFE